MTSYVPIPGQLPPGDNAWRIWLLLGGRASGKTRAGAEYVNHRVRTSPSPLNILIIGRTNADARASLIEGPAGIIASAHPTEDLEYRPGIRTINWRSNNSKALVISARQPDLIRGLEPDLVWGDDVSEWTPELWQNVKIATRKAGARIILTTTPPIEENQSWFLNQLREEVMDDPILTRQTTLNTFQNLDANPEFVKIMRNTYYGTRAARSQLFGELP